MIFKFNTVKALIVSAILLGSYSCNVISIADSTIKDPIEQLIASMSIEEKVGQTCQVTLDVVAKFNGNVAVDPAAVDEEKLKEALVDYKVGSILNVGSHTLSREEWNSIINSVNRPYNEGKIKIPVMYGIDAIHGMNYTTGATLFPQEIGLAATWNEELVEKCASVTAYEVRASGIRWNFSPVLDLGRQPLWSRHFETLGEDPFLCSQLGAAMINGYQGRGSIGQDKVASCMKHFVGYSAAQSGRDRTPAWIPDKYMRELYLPSFKKAVESGAMTVMINSGVVNGFPGHTNYHLITEVLKGEYGFEGFAVSDWEDFIMLHTVHRTSATLAKAYVSAFNAGVDMSMVPLSPQYKEYCNIMVAAVKNGDIKMDRLNDAVRRILRVKKKLGLFEKESFDPSAYPEFGSKDSKMLSMNAALESITLLKNEKNALPLKKGKRVLVAGPTANNLIFLNGAWTHTWQGVDTNYNTNGCLTVKQSFEQYLGKASVLYSKGAELYIENGFERSRFVDLEDYKNKLTSCDVVVLCLGEMPSTEKPGDIHSLDLDEEQKELAKLAFKSGKEVVLVLLEGRPRIINPIVDGANAIVQCYLPGDHGAEALIKLLYGEVDFSGRLPYTYPKYNGVIEFYDHPSSVDRSKSGDFSAYDPQWDFGYGLSYSKAEYSGLKLSGNQLTGDETLNVTVTVKNMGNGKLKETVQLYLSDDYATLIPAGKRLRGFKKIELLPGETRDVIFEIGKNDLIFYNNEEQPVLENGSFTIAVQDLKSSFEYQLK